MKSEPTKVATVSFEDLEKASKAFRLRCSEKNNQLILNTLPNAVAYISDLDIHLELSFRTGLKRVEGCQPDIILSFRLPFELPDHGMGWRNISHQWAIPGASGR